MTNPHTVTFASRRSDGYALSTINYLTFDGASVRPGTPNGKYQV